MAAVVTPKRSVMLWRLPSMASERARAAPSRPCSGRKAARISAVRTMSITSTRAVRATAVRAAPAASISWVSKGVMSASRRSWSRMRSASSAEPVRARRVPRCCSRRELAPKMESDRPSQTRLRPWMPAWTAPKPAPRDSPWRSWPKTPERPRVLRSALSTWRSRRCTSWPTARSWALARSWVSMTICSSAAVAMALALRPFLGVAGAGRRRPARSAGRPPPRRRRRGWPSARPTPAEAPCRRRGRCGSCRAHSPAGSFFPPAPRCGRPGRR